MKNIVDLNLGSNDAEDYKRKELKLLFNDIFIRDHNLDKLMQPSTFFLIGEKGTGKTAYGVFLANSDYRNTRAQIKYIRETQYQKFVALKNEKHLALSDYTSIWKVIILVLIASKITKDDIGEPLTKSRKLFAVKDAIDQYYNHAFSPEISTIMQMVDDTKGMAKLVLEAINVGVERGTEVTFSETKFQTNLQYIERRLIEALMSIKLKSNQFLFIDGIDIRPSGIEYKEYLSCVKGLAEAVWALNNDEFAVSNGSIGRIKVISLIRPDIFQSVGLQNSTNKIMNNSVFLDWRTTYPDHRASNLFKVAEKLLAYQQLDADKPKSIGEVWDHYFNWKSPSTSRDREYDSPFIEFLRLTYSRPRDIVTIIQIMKTIQARTKPNLDYFEQNTFLSREFQNAYSEYLMGGIKDQLSFYYSEENYQMLLYFLAMFKKKAEFDYRYYEDKYNEFVEYVLKKATELPAFIEEKEMFLQFLYDLNIICYVDEGPSGQPLISWCYRDRNLSNMSPKVEFGKKYRFHYGLRKALNL